MNTASNLPHMTTTAISDHAMLSRDEAAAYLRLRSCTLARWAREDRGPPFHKLSPARCGRILYAVADLDTWVRCGCPTNTRGARPSSCPPGAFADQHGDLRRNPNGRFTRRGPP